MEFTIDQEIGRAMLQRYSQMQGRTLPETACEDILRILELVTEVAHEAYQQGVNGQPFEPMLPLASKNAL